jgi:separase
MQRTRTTIKAKPTPDDLAHQLASVLTISNAKGTQGTSAATEERRLSAMRAVNIASHSLSSTTSKGKRPEGASKDTSRRHLSESAASAARSLRELRILCPGGVDVERASSSVIGKLIALEMVWMGCIFSLFFVKLNERLGSSMQGCWRWRK